MIRNSASLATTTLHHEAGFLALKDKPNLGIEAEPEIAHRIGDLPVAIHCCGIKPNR